MYASADEVRRAIDGLTPLDFHRLLKAAQIYMGGTPYSTAKDLLVDVLGTAFDAACGGKGRRWPREVAFTAYLFMTMRGVASDLRREAGRRRATFLRELTDLFDSLHCSPPALEESLAAEEDNRQEDQDSEHLAKVRDHFRDDEQVSWVMKGIMEGVPAREILRQSGMTNTQYETAHRRWRRGLEQLFPGRRMK